MRIFTYLTLLLLATFALTFTSCSKKKKKAVTASPVNVYDSSDKALEEERISIEETININENVDSLKSKPSSTTTAATSGKTSSSSATTASTKKKDDVRKTSAKVETMKKADGKRLKKYNVVIATLSKQSGVNRLSKSLDQDGINYFVANDKRSGYYFFVVASSDSEAEAIEARKEFLKKATVNKTRKEIWDQYDIYVTDTYILENR